MIQAHTKNTGTSRTDLEQSVVSEFRAIVQKINLDSARLEKTCGVSSAQLCAMREINQNPGIRVSGVAHALDIHASTASNMLDKLESRKLIRRQRGDADQRAVRLYLTAAGKRLLLRAPTPESGALNAALGGLSDAEVRSLSRSMKNLRNAFP